MAFVPGDALKRFPLYQGLPTLEKHRGMNPYVAAVELMTSYRVTDIAIGDSKAQLSTLQMIYDYMQQKVINYVDLLDFVGPETAVCLIPLDEL
jgi:hypothetical protein